MPLEAVLKPSPIPLPTHAELPGVSPAELQHAELRELDLGEVFPQHGRRGYCWDVAVQGRTLRNTPAVPDRAMAKKEAERHFRDLEAHVIADCIRDYVIPPVAQAGPSN